MITSTNLTRDLWQNDRLVRLGKIISNNERLLLVLFSILSSLIVYAPFYKDMRIIPMYWDGPNYLYVAKTLYDIPENHPFVPYQTTPKYFACHLPLYPLLIRALSFFGYEAAMIIVTLVSTALATLAFYELLKQTKAVESPFWSSLLFLFVPSRWLIYHSVGATEPLFLLLVFLSLLSFHKNKFFLSFLLAALAGTTRIVGVLLGPVYLILLVHSKQWKKILLLLLIPLGLLITFTFYHYIYGDFWAYFRWNHKLLRAEPFVSFISFAKSGATHAAEYYLCIFALSGIGLALLWKQYLFFVYGIIFYLFSIFIFHEDLSRYTISYTCFTLIVAYDQILKKTSVRLVFLLLYIPLSYIYAWQIIPKNVIAEWVYKNLLSIL